MLVGYNFNPCDESLWDAIKDSGADYIETNFSAVCGMDDEQYKKIFAVYKKTGIPIMYANGLLNPSFVLVGENTSSDEELIGYLEKGFARMVEMGAKTIVLGSGAARKVPEGFPLQKAKEQMLHAAKVITGVAKKYGCSVVIEPLCHLETNMINTVKAASEFAKMQGEDGIMALADSFHMRAENEDFSTLKNYKDTLKHAHISESKAGSVEIRRLPDAKDEYKCKEFADALLEMGYDGNLTIECFGRGGDFKSELREAVKVVKSWVNANK